MSNPGPGGGKSASLNFTIRTSKPTSTTRHYPRLVSGISESAGFAVVNLGSTDATLTLWAFDRSGTEIKGPEVTNPALICLKGFEQLPVLDS